MPFGPSCSPQVHSPRRALSQQTPRHPVHSPRLQSLSAETPAPLTQTPAPDNSALSLLFQGLKVEQQAGGNRSDANHLALRIPLMVGGTAKLKAELRGSIAADKGVECRISLDGPDGRTVLMARNMPQAYMKTYIPVSASDGELKLMIGLRCTGKSGSKPFFLAEIDSLDLSVATKSGR